MSPPSASSNDPIAVLTAPKVPVVGDRKEYHAHFDCFSGAAGDMLLASCLDASGDPEYLRHHVTNCLARGMPALADEFKIETKRVWKGGMGSIAGMHVNVVSRYNDKPAPVPERTNGGKNENDDGHTDSNYHGHDHDHDHYHGHKHHSTNANVEGGESEPDNDNDNNPGAELHFRAHNHSHAHSHTENSSNDHSRALSHTSSTSNSELNGPLRNLKEIRKLLEESDDSFIAPWVKSTAIVAFTELAKAEATTHGARGIEAVHFHEVGAVDSIVDTVGTLVALHYLGATTFSCSRIPIGEGSVWTDHGILPVPAPATLRLLVGMPTCPGPMGVVTGELVTPTGAALLRTLCLGGKEGNSTNNNNNNEKTPTPKLTGRPPSFTIRNIGIGAGSKDFERHPNILRLLIGDDVVTK